ncbi:MAG: WD40 repeat domain-containing protein, partial [Anaerolineae bacterium]|nr:WD40 repeat domain-containing protein [Anaerolineae bacterium]
VPRQSLKTIIQQYGEAVSTDPKRVEALLRDYCGEYRREIFVLVSALEEGVADELRRMKSAPPTAQLSTGVLIPRLARELHETTALSEEAALWGVQAWAEALEMATGTAQVMPPLRTSQTPAPQTKGEASGVRLAHTLVAHAGEVSDLAFSPDGRQLASVGFDAVAHIWEVGNGEAVTSLRQQTGILTGVAWHPDGLSLALSSGDWGIYLWRWLDPGSDIPRLRGHRGSVTRVVYINPELLASAGRDGVVHIWKANEATIATTLRGHTDAVLDLAVSPDGETLASAGGWDRTVRIWDLAQAGTGHQGKELWTLTGHTAQVTCVSFGAGNAAAGSGSWDETVRIWDLKRGQELARFAQTEETVRPISALSIDPSGDLLAAGDWQGAICLWQIRTRTLLDTLTQHQGHVRRVAFSPGGNWLASADSEGTLCLWRVAR